ncbi:hypothetical protein SDC9_198137 [bioreactor metagenome]|uniref:Uncharacterized protein n=1 Tax=bioreactor metagenome TaxID=1076179 RepID=A0A645IHB8_9ZZZZ
MHVGLFLLIVNPNLQLLHLTSKFVGFVKTHGQSQFVVFGHLIISHHVPRFQSPIVQGNHEQTDRHTLNLSRAKVRHQSKFYPNHIVNYLEYFQRKQHYLVTRSQFVNAIRSN